MMFVWEAAIQRGGNWKWSFLVFCAVWVTAYITCLVLMFLVDGAAETLVVHVGTVLEVHGLPAVAVAIWRPDKFRSEYSDNSYCC